MQVTIRSREIYSKKPTNIAQMILVMETLTSSPRVQKSTVLPPRVFRIPPRNAMNADSLWKPFYFGRSLFLSPFANEIERDQRKFYTFQETGQVREREEGFSHRVLRFSNCEGDNDERERR
ncbi:hypothetical protein SUGI_1089750 [Cryptomeria japonica]|nr:hypothetical protein SUGI_1089750 [Cryptomeria japonica]